MNVLLKRLNLQPVQEEDQFYNFRKPGFACAPFEHPPHKGDFMSPEDSLPFSWVSQLIAEGRTPRLQPILLRIL